MINNINNNLLCKIFAYRPRENRQPKEEFLTQCFAFYLEQSEGFRIIFFNKVQTLFKDSDVFVGCDLKHSDFKIQPEKVYHIKGLTKSLRFDIKVTITNKKTNKEFIVIIESKCDSSVDSIQLKNYYELYLNKNNKKGVVLLISEGNVFANELPINSAAWCQAMKWVTVYNLLSEYKPNNDPIENMYQNELINLMKKHYSVLTIDWHKSMKTIEKLSVQEQREEITKILKKAITAKQIDILGKDGKNLYSDKLIDISKNKKYPKFAMNIFPNLYNYHTFKGKNCLFLIGNMKLDIYLSNSDSPRVQLSILVSHDESHMKQYTQNIEWEEIQRLRNHLSSVIYFDDIQTIATTEETSITKICDDYANAHNISSENVHWIDAFAYWMRESIDYWHDLGILDIISDWWGGRLKSWEAK